MRRAFALSIVMTACVEESPVAGPADGLPADLEIEPAIFHGTAANLARHNGVVGLVDAWGSLVCTGSLVRSDLVLTAAHCADGIDLAWIAGGLDLMSPNTVFFPISHVDIHPNWNNWTLDGDLAMLTLGQPVPRVVRPLLPATTTHPARSTLIGTQAEAVGYGATETGSAGFRLHADVPILDIDSGHVTVDNAQAGPCYGDSGGPLLATVDGALRIIGVASYVVPAPQGDCVGDAGYTRLDSYTSWLATF